MSLRWLRAAWRSMRASARSWRRRRSVQLDALLVQRDDRPQPLDARVQPAHRQRQVARPQRFQDRHPGQVVIGFGLRVAASGPDPGSERRARLHPAPPAPAPAAAAPPGGRRVWPGSSRAPGGRAPAAPPPAASCPGTARRRRGPVPSGWPGRSRPPPPSIVVQAVKLCPLEIELRTFVAGVGVGGAAQLLIDPTGDVGDLLVQLAVRPADRRGGCPDAGYCNGGHEQRQVPHARTVYTG